SIVDDPAVRTARDTLQQVMADPTSTTQQIQDAADKLESAIDGASVADKGAREAARTALENAQPVSNEPGVKTAYDAVQAVLNNPAATTEQVTAATSGLTSAVGPSKTDRIKANDDAHTLVNTVTASPVGTEPAVQDAIAKLNAVVDQAATDSPEALTADIRKAMDDLTAAQKTAQTARDAATDAAKTAITSSNDPAVATDPQVTAARDALQQVLKDPTATTAQITDATNALTKAIGGAVTADGAARDAAQKALDATKPVSYEPSVKAARDAAQKALDDPTSTLNQVTDATTALTNATGAAKTDRTSAIDDAGKLITTVTGSPVANETPVKDAITKLNAVIEKSKTDSPEALTADIRTAMDDLTAAQKTAQTARDNATSDANTAITVSNNPLISTDPAVVAARDALQKVLKDPSSTTQQIIDATKKLNDASRTAAIGQANTATKTAQDSAVSNEPPVIAAIDNLTEIVGDPASTVQQILDGITGLNTAVNTATQARGDAIKQANTAITVAVPFLDVPAVKDASDKLTKVLDDPTSTTADIIKATDDLTKVTRQAAIDQANQVIEVVEKSEVSKNPPVIEAIDQLEDVMKDPTSTVPQIVAATDNLNKVVAQAKSGATTAVTTSTTPKVSVKTGGQVLASGSDSVSGLTPALGVALALFIGAGAGIATGWSRRPVRKVAGK
ncbi:MAG: hypothetical protein LBV00_03140, partial [Propionibacteriaceae bacterium]|nr:hypothetical protein [Propionibacteriaceae bacterium]